MAILDAVASLLSAAAQRLSPGAGAVSRVDAAPLVTSADRTDCGPGGCGPGGALYGAGGYGVGGIAGNGFIGLDRMTIEALYYSDQFLRMVVNKILEDGMSKRPSLAGEDGEMSSCIEWLDERGFWDAAKRAMLYARMYGGGGVVCLIDDGRPSYEEVNLAGIRGVLGFYALPKWYLTPADAGSPRVQAGWYGQRIGRPEHYLVTPNIPIGGGDPGDIGAVMKGSAGGKFHRSRIIPWQYCDEMDLRLARRYANGNGWGPGVVESILQPYLARKEGQARINGIIRSLVVNVLSMPDVTASQSTPTGGVALRAALDWLKACRDYTEDGVPIVAIDKQSTLSSLSHTVSGANDLLAAQRQFLLDTCSEYPAVALFGDSVGGLSGGDREGEWMSYYNNVDTWRSWAWSGGTFGGGIRQAVLLSQAVPSGPTFGRMDYTTTPTWPSLWKASAKEQSATRLTNAQARAQDKLALNLTTEAMVRHDPTVKESYPSLDVDEGPLPELAGNDATGVTAPAIGDPSAAPSAMTPGATNEALAAQAAPGEQTDATTGPPAPPLVMPTDIKTEADLAACMSLTRPALRKLLEAQGVKPYPMPKGTRGGHRYSLAEVMRAWQRDTTDRADALMRRTTR